MIKAIVSPPWQKFKTEAYKSNFIINDCIYGFTLVIENQNWNQ